MTEKFNEKISILEREKIKDFIEAREIKPEDFHFIEELAIFPKNTIIGPMHNFFLLNHENSLRELERSVESAKENGNEERQKMYGLFLEFCQKYDWDASQHLERILENL